MLSLAVHHSSDGGDPCAPLKSSRHSRFHPGGPGPGGPCADVSPVSVFAATCRALVPIPEACRARNNMAVARIHAPPPLPRLCAGILRLKDFDAMRGGLGVGHSLVLLYEYGRAQVINSLQSPDAMQSPSPQATNQDSLCGRIASEPHCAHAAQNSNAQPQTCARGSTTTNNRQQYLNLTNNI